MGWEDVDRSLDHTRPEDIVITLGLSRFGELVGRIASEVHRFMGLDEFDPHSDEAEHVVIDAWRYCCHMADRAEFEKSVSADLDRLNAAANAQGGESPLGVQHLPEFGGAAPLPDHAPKSLERRLEPPV